jgi:5'-nucleotidase
MKRREWIKTTVTLGTFSLLSSLSEVAEAEETATVITILHTNDWHSRIEPFPPQSGKFAGQGGAAARAAIIERIRKEQKHVILLDAGDIFQGTPYFNFFEGELEYKLMTAMGYDAATLGNHDFDNGIEGILKQMKHAEFELINCNYDFNDTLLASKIKPYKIIQKGGVKIGIIGVGINLNGLVPNELWKGIIYRDPVFYANQFARELKHQKGCDFVICLSHLGYEYQDGKISDKKLAAQSSHIDIILGGHTHTFLPEPVSVLNTLNRQVLVNQVGWAGLQLGRIDVTFDKRKKPVNTGVSSVLDVFENNG